ncbi:hypothetical protein BIFBRE_03559 [Bifidobacterium breve DSM 20213 = JCM 1192]|uniref:Uncharacterized protein n=1 Tax=Bifidobacterium breve DSM 20213 = JCM 1192 TaxID=518634 RepID=D4BNB0_BIFBR|nr:hypothetical protein BIFBRE_03559 [Bifidobacterium breve DSM 20213 = JCM 1192]
MLDLLGLLGLLGLLDLPLSPFALPDLKCCPLPCLVGPDGRGRVAGSGMTLSPCR